MATTRWELYEIIRELGRGGMGTVYEAFRRDIRRRVAIKMLLPKFSRDPEFHARFLREAWLANRVSDSGIVQCIDYGYNPDGIAFLVMDYLEGETLKDRLVRAGGRLPPGDMVRFGTMLARTLRAMHRAHVVHRDVKPSNIMLVSDSEVPGGERTKITDFGIAKLLSHVDDKEQELDEPTRRETDMGMKLGSAWYEAPEQCRSARDVSGKVDVYSLGVILYEMAAGTVPFRGNPDLVRIQQLYEKPRPLTEVAPHLPADIMRLVHSMLEKNPDLRPDSEQVAHELEKIRVQMAQEEPIRDSSTVTPCERSVPLDASPANLRVVTESIGPDFSSEIEESLSTIGTLTSTETPTTWQPVVRNRTRYLAVLTLVLGGAGAFGFRSTLGGCNQRGLIAGSGSSSSKPPTIKADPELTIVSVVRKPRLEPFIPVHVEPPPALQPRQFAKKAPGPLHPATEEERLDAKLREAFRRLSQPEASQEPLPPTQ